jgi:hypothetical protein
VLHILGLNLGIQGTKYCADFEDFVLSSVTALCGLQTLLLSLSLSTIVLHPRMGVSRYASFEKHDLCVRV